MPKLTAIIFCCNWIVFTICKSVIAKVTAGNADIIYAVRTNESTGIGVIVSGLEIVEAEVVGIVIIATITEWVQVGDGFGSIFRFGGYLGKRLRTVIICPNDLTIRV